jgi:hypothetical protein
MKHYLQTFAQAKDKQLSTMSLNPTLISGFEDVINHIKQQEQRVMGLEEQNKKLRKKLEEKEEKMGDEAIECLKFMGYEWSPDKGWNEKEESEEEESDEEQVEQLQEELRGQVVPENIKAEWTNIYQCLLEEEDGYYRQEGHDPEVETSELEDGWTYTSMRRINDWINN